MADDAAAPDGEAERVDGHRGDVDATEPEASGTEVRTRPRPTAQRTAPTRGTTRAADEKPRPRSRGCRMCGWRRSSGWSWWWRWPV